MAAVVPQDLVEEYKNKHLDNTLVSIHHIQIEYINPTEYPRHNNYSFVRNDVLIVVNSKMVVSQILFPDMTGFVNHPWLPSIRGLLEDKSTKKMLIGTHN